MTDPWLPQRGKKTENDIFVMSPKLARHCFVDAFEGWCVAPKDA
jgi:hypothetical protein